MKEIELTKGQIALIDDCDFEEVSKHSWCILDLRKRRNGLMYAQSRINNKIVYLHRFIMQPGPGLLVDHENGNGLHCWRKNLRVVPRYKNHHNPRGLNVLNTSGVNGVCWSKTKQKFQVEIVIAGKRQYLGRFASLEEATKVRRAAEQKIWEE